MSDNPLSGKVGLDTTDFKTGVAELNREIRVIESGFRAAAAGMGDWDKTSAGLEARIKALTGQIELQQRKVAAIEAEYKRVAKEKGNTSKAAQDLQIRLNRENETLNKMQGELKESKTALDGMGKEAKTAGGKLDDLAKKEDKASSSTSRLSGLMKGLGSGIKAGVAGIAAIGGAAAAAVAGLAALVLKSSKNADELSALSTITGLSVTRLQELKYIAAATDQDFDTLTGSVSKLTRSLVQAKKDGSPAAEAFKELGINIFDANGNIRDSQDILFEAINALGSMGNETEADMLAMQLFGRSALELKPIIQTEKDEMNRLAAEAHNVGAVMSEEDVAAADKLNDSLDQLKLGFGGIVNTLLGALMPGLLTLTTKGKDYLTGFVKAFSGMKEMPLTSKKMLGDLVTNLLKDITNFLPQIMGMGVTILQSVVTGLLAVLPTLLPVAIQILNSLIQFVVDNLPLLVTAALQIVVALINALLPQLPKLVLAALQIIITLANGISQALPQLIPAIVAIIPQIITVLIENLPLLVQAALQLILALVQGIIAALPILITAIPQLVQAIVTAIIASLPMIGDAAVQLVMTLLTGIIGMLPTLGTAAGRLVDVLIDGFNALGSEIIKVGVDIVLGIWQGIQDKADWFGKQVMSFFKNIVDGVKKALGIESPSKVFGEIGQNMAAGLGVGFTKAFGQISKDVDKAIIGMANVNVSGAGTPSNQAQQMKPAPNVYVTVQANKPLDIYLLARQVAAEIQKG